MSQHFDVRDLWLAGTLLTLLTLYVLHVVSKAVLNYHWKRMTRHWPKSQHRSYFSDCRRVPEDDAL